MNVLRADDHGTITIQADRITWACTRCPGKGKARTEKSANRKLDRHALAAHRILPTAAHSPALAVFTW